jgi:hydrogenase maturation protease
VKQLLIAGIGNVLLGDDGVGSYIARLLSARYDFGDEVEVADLGTPGLDLVAHIAGYRYLILIDSVDNDAPAGAITTYRKDEIMRVQPQMRMDPHSPALLETLFVSELAGEGAEEVLLIGITGRDYDRGPSMTREVHSAVAAVIDDVLQEATRLGFEHREKLSADVPSIWWMPVAEPFPVVRK